MAIRGWGDTYVSPDDPPAHYRHRDCTGEAHVQHTCGTDVTARDITLEPGPVILAHLGRPEAEGEEQRQ
ncbi:hypothetical protein AB0D24_39535 [Streptomyces javensis]|uniref:hypothetical protein n=1 Tax=Streptomyces javensis TaxID=114698 RepID=UPI0034115C88